MSSTNIRRRLERLELQRGRPGGRRLPFVALSVYGFAENGSLLLVRGREPLSKWGKNVIWLRILPPDPESAAERTARLAAAEVPAPQFIETRTPEWPVRPAVVN